MNKIKTALISVSDKEGIVEFAKELNEQGIEILSTSGTSSFLKDNRIFSTPISDYTGQEEVLDGRVKSLHPKIFAGILVDRTNEKHMIELREKGIKLIDIVVVNLYAFKETSLKQNVELKEVVEKIDIGGHCLIRAAIKNYPYVVVVVDPRDYLRVIQEIREAGTVYEKTRKDLVSKALKYVTEQDLIIKEFFEKWF